MTVWTPTRRAMLAGMAALPLLPARAAFAAQSTAFVVLGDWGRYGDKPQREVAAAMGEAAAEIQSRFVIATGDNFYPAGVSSVHDPHWKQSFEDVYTAPALQTPWWSALGNHDYRGVPHAQIAYSAHSPRWRMPGRYYRVGGHQLGASDLDLFVIDTQALVETPHETMLQVIHGHLWLHRRERQLAWLERALSNSRAAWKIVVGHHPIYSGSHGGEAFLLERVAPLLERHGVQAYFNGHDHDLQHIRRGSVDYLCSGAGSDTNPVRAIEGTQFCASQLGFAAVAIEGSEMTATFRDHLGRTLHSAQISQTNA